LSEVNHPALLLRSQLKSVLDDLAILSRFPKDCSCPDHNGPHVVMLTRKKAIENYAPMFEALRNMDMSEDVAALINQILVFSEEERHRQSIYIKDLKFYATDLYPEKKKV
jgi:hypothetical protein